MKTIGVGVIGCGFVGRGAHVPAFAAIPAASLVAVADPDEKRLAKAAAKFEVPGRYTDYAELVKDPAVDAVVVAAPTPLHAPAALAAIAAGKHVLCEMPLAADLEEADRLIDAAQAQGVVLMPGLTFRFTPNYVKAKSLIDDGKLGKPVAVTYREFIPAADLARQWPPGSWVWNLEESGGPLYTLCVWSVDLIRWLFGSEVQTLQANASYTELPQFGGTLGYDASVTLRLANGLVGCLQYSGSFVSSASTSALEVTGDGRGVLRATDNHGVTLYGDDPAKTEWNVRAPGAGAWGHLQQDTYFVDCLQKGQSPSITPLDGRRAMEIAAQITH